MSAGETTEERMPAILSRRHFVLSIGAAGVGATWTLGCGSDPTVGMRGDDGPRPASDAGLDAAVVPVRSASCEGLVGTITIRRNHGHRMIVTREDVERRIPKTYDIRGTSAHAHQVSLTAEHFAALERREAVMVVSSSAEGHEHQVLVECAPI